MPPRDINMFALADVFIVLLGCAIGCYGDQSCSIWKLPKMFGTSSTSGPLGPTSCVAHVRILHRTVCILPLGYVVYTAR